MKYINYGIADDVLYCTFWGIIGILLTALIVKKIYTSSETIAFSAKKLESNDVMLLGVVGSYIVPFISKASEITMVSLLAIYFGAAIIFSFMGSIPPHPLLRALRFRFYKVESDVGVVYTLISRRDILSPKDILRVKRISSSMLMEIK